MHSEACTANFSPSPNGGPSRATLQHSVGARFVPCTVLFDKDDLPQTWKQPGIYQITCIFTLKTYVGSSKSVYDRLLCHLSTLRNNKHHSKKLQRAYNKYGPAAFVAKFVAPLDLFERWDIEGYYIDIEDAYQHGYNGRPDAKCGLGLQATEQRKRLSAESNKRTWADPALRKALSEKFKGRKRGLPTLETPKRMSDSMKKAHALNPELRKAIRYLNNDPNWTAKRISAMLSSPKFLPSRNTTAMLSDKIKQKKHAVLLMRAFVHHDLEARFGFATPLDFAAQLAWEHRNGLGYKRLAKKYSLHRQSIKTWLKAESVLQHWFDE